MSYNFNKFIMFASGEVYKEALELFILMQAHHPSAEDLIVLNWDRDGVISDQNSIRVNFRFISFFLCYLESH